MTQYTLVTGGAGFIGSFLVEQLLANGHAVRVIDALVPQVHGEDASPKYLPPDVDFIKAPLEDSAAVRQALIDVNIVIHLAAEVGPTQSLYEITRYVGGNTYGTAVLLQEMLPFRDRIERMLVASSMAVYGEGEYHCPACDCVVAPPLRSEAQLRERRWEVFCPMCGSELTPIPTRETKQTYPGSIYGITKHDQEELCMLYGQAYNVPTTGLRFFNTYGPRQALSNPYTGVAAIFSGRLLNGKPPLIFEDGKQSRDLTHVSDLVRGILGAMRSERAVGGVFNLAGGRPLSIKEIAIALVKALDVDIEPQLTGQYRAQDIRHCFADLSAAHKAFDYQPQVAFEDGISELISWVRDQQVVERVEEANSEIDRMGLLR